MLSDDELDSYVSSLLTSQAQRQAASYSSVGFRAFLRSAGKEGPVGKPNTRFLRNVVRDVDQHNTALRLKEERESRERLRELRRRDVGDRMNGFRDEEGGGGRERSREEDWRERRERERSRSRSRRDGRDGSDERRERKRPRRDGELDDDRWLRRGREERRSRRDADGHRTDSRERRHSHRHSRSVSQERRQSRHHISRERHKSHRRERSERQSRRGHSEIEDFRQSRHSRRSISPSRRDPKQSHHHRHHHHHRSPSVSSTESETSPPRRSSRKRHSPSPANRSPNRAGIISPSPLSASQPRSPSPGPNPTIAGPEHLRHKGRGALHGGTLDQKFHPTYDPKTDTQPPSPSSSSSEETGPTDDWGLALRALRQRQQYILSGAMTDRLKETQMEIQTQGTGAQAPVYPKSTGEREWDRGKVVLDDGSVGVTVWDKTSML